MSFAGKDKRVDKKPRRHHEELHGETNRSPVASNRSGRKRPMVFMGNTKKSVTYMLKNSHFFDQLPDKYIDSAFLDRIHAYIPGWEVSPIQNELFTTGYGLIVDYLAEILSHLRDSRFLRSIPEVFSISTPTSPLAIERECKRPLLV